MLIFFFIFALFVLILQGGGVFFVPFHAFLPWVCLCILKKPGQGLFMAALAGAMIDLLSDCPFGVYPISYTLTAAILLRFRLRFLYTNPLHFTVFNVFGSLVASVLELFFLFLFDRRVPISGQWILCGVGIMDGLYAFVISGLIYLWIRGFKIWQIWIKKWKGSLS